LQTSFYAAETCSAGAPVEDRMDVLPADFVKYVPMDSATRVIDLRVKLPARRHRFFETLRYPF